MSKNANEVDAREMAAAPIAVVERKGKEKENRFDKHFGSISFSTISNPGEPLIFDKGALTGTKQTRLAEAVIEIGQTGAYIQGAFVVKREHPSGTIEFLLQLPSSGGKFKKPMVDVSEDEHAADDLAVWCSRAIDAWKAYRRAQVKAGLTKSGPVSKSGVKISDDEMLELGLV